MLKPGGLLFCADPNLPSGQDFDKIAALWQAHSVVQGTPQKKADVMASKLGEMRSQWWRQEEQVKLLAEAGLVNGLQVFQSLMYGAFCCNAPAA